MRRITHSTMPRSRHALLAVAALTTLSMSGCGGSDSMRVPPTAPAPALIANVYILPGAVSLNDHAFGDETIVIYKGERMRWVNVDALPHQVVADSPDATDFRETVELSPGGEQSFLMTKLGTTGIRCATHPNMTGTLTVRER